VPPVNKANTLPRFTYTTTDDIELASEDVLVTDKVISYEVSTCKLKLGNTNILGF
jgi:hypothetical protein